MSGVEIFTRDVNGVAVPVSDAHPLPTTGGGGTGGGGTDMGPTNTLLGAKTEPAPADDTASSGLNGRLQRIAQRLTDLIAATGGGGGADMTATNILLGALVETAPLTDTASSGLNGRLQRVSQRLTSLIALMPASIGQKARAASLAVAMSAEDQAQIGGLTEVAPASDTASSGLNGRLQRIAQNITSMIAKWPAALGSLAAAASLAVTSSIEDVARIGATSETAPASDTALSGLNGRLQRIAQNLTTLIGSTTAVRGQTAAGSAISQQPVTTGGRAAVSALPGVVGDGTVVNAMFDRFGRQIAVPTQRELKGKGYVTLSTTVSTTLLAADATYFQDIYAIIVTNRGATAGWVTFSDNGFVQFIIFCPSGDTRGFMLDAGSAIPQGVINTAWTVQASVASTFEVTAYCAKNK